MLVEGKVTVDEAERLLSAVEQPPGGESMAPPEQRERQGPAKYFRIQVAEGDGSEHVAIRVPIALIRAGMKLHTLIPANASEGINKALRDKGIDFDVRNLKAEDFDEFVDALSDLEIDVRDGDSKVHIFAE